MRRSLGALVFALFACGGAPSDGATQAEDELRASRPLRDEDFARPLDEEAVRGSSTLARTATDADPGRTKWLASLAGGRAIFYRSYPAAFHEDLARLAPAARLPGRTTTCVGDGHPDNFGFLELSKQDGGKKTIYAFNDLDDAGPCQVAVDALRYFTGVRMFFDRADKDETIDDYLDALFDASRGSIAPGVREPDWVNVRSAELAATTRGDAFVLDGAVMAVSASERARVLALLGTEARLKGTRMLDVARYTKTAGGSGGLGRFWILADRPGSGRTILEMKEAARPAVELGPNAPPLPTSERLGSLKRDLWDAKTDDDYFYVSLDATTYLVRDRCRKDGIKSMELGRSERKDLLRAQAHYLAGIHRGAWGSASKPVLRSWLEKSSETVYQRWKSAFDAAAATTR